MTKANAHSAPQKAPYNIEVPTVYPARAFHAGLTREGTIVTHIVIRNPLVSPSIATFRNINQMPLHHCSGCIVGSSLAVKVIVTGNHMDLTMLIIHTALRLGYQYVGIFLPTVSKTFRDVTINTENHE